MKQPSALGWAGSLALLIVGVSSGAAVLGVALATSYALAAVILVLGLIRARARITATPVTWLVAALFTLYFLVSLFSPATDWFYAFVALVAVPGVFAFASMSERERRGTSIVVVWFGLVSAALAVWETFGRNALIIPKDRLGLSAHAFVPGAVRAEVFAGQPLVLGFLLAVSAALLLRSGARRWWKILGLVILFAGIVATGSAGMLIVAAIVVIAHLFVTMGPVGRLNLALASVAAGIYLAVSTGVFATIASEVFGGNAAQRINSIAAFERLFTLREVDRAMFGNGWNSASELYATGVIRQTASMAVDNQFIATLVDVGLLGLIAVAALLIVSFRSTPAVAHPAWLATFGAFFTFDLMLWVFPTLIAMFIWSERKPAVMREAGMQAEASIPAHA